MLIQTRVSNGTGQYNFLGQQDRSFFIVPGQRDNGTMGQAQSLDKGRDGTAKIWDGTGRDSQNPGRGTKRDRAEKEMDVLKQERMF